MTIHMTRTPLSGAATEDMTSGLLLGFPDAAWYGLPNPFPSFPRFKAMVLMEACPTTYRPTSLGSLGSIL
jgi:hypothetical protein